MSIKLQEFLATAAEKQAVDLEKAVLRLPEDKRNWSPMGDARSALDQAAECAILASSTADLLKNRAWDADFDMAAYERHKSELAQDGDAVLALLKENVPKVAAAIRAIPDEDMGVPVQMPWGPMTLGQIAAYPYWNMTYHEGAINFIASMLGCLDYVPST